MEISLQTTFNKSKSACPHNSAFDPIWIEVTSLFPQLECFGLVGVTYQLKRNGLFSIPEKEKGAI